MAGRVLDAYCGGINCVVMKRIGRLIRKIVLSGADGGNCEENNDGRGLR